MAKQTSQPLSVLDIWNYKFPYFEELDNIGLRKGRSSSATKGKRGEFVKKKSAQNDNKGKFVLLFPEHRDQEV